MPTRKTYNQQDSKAESRESKVNAGQVPSQGAGMPQPVAQPMPMPMPSMLQMTPPPRRPRGWRERWMERFGMNTATTSLGKGELTIPNWLIGKSLAFFFIAMFACWGVLGFIPDIRLVLLAILSVVLFFYGGAVISKSWSRVGRKGYVNKIYIFGLVIRVAWVLYRYFFFNPEYYANTYGDTADVDWYMPFAKELAQWLSGDSLDSLSQIIENNGAAIDDTGYPMWLGILYMVFGEDNDIFIPLIIKCLLGAYCAISIYYIARRHFGEGVARMTAIFVCVNPNMIYWCGSMMKETEMLFLVCLAIDNFDRVLTSNKRFTFVNLLPGMLATIALMFFRSVLGIVIFLAVFSHIIMASRRVMSMGKKIIAGLIVGVVLMISMGDRIRTQSEALIEKAHSDSQEKNMEWRSNRKYDEGGQQTFAKYAGAAVFAPLIFTIPFPTFSAAHAGQLLQVQLSGGSYIKNILSFFVILVMFMMLISGEWRRHVFILAYTLGYLMVLVMSPFAHSGRFHMPIWPMLMLFAAYGVQIAKTNPRVRKWFPIVLVFEVVACLAWNWFKLKGRGMI